MASFQERLSEVATLTVAGLFAYAKKITVEELYEQFAQAIELANSLSGEWHPRAKPYCEKAVATLRKFMAGEAGTPDVKYHFATLSTLGGMEVLMNDKQSFAVYSLTEVAHAAAHLGHLSVAASRMGESNRMYETLQKYYVVMGMLLVKHYHDQVVGVPKAVAPQKTESVPTNWRQQPPTQRQVETLRKYGTDVPSTRGEASNAISELGRQVSLRKRVRA